MLAFPEHFWQGLRSTLTDRQDPREIRSARVAGGGSAINGQVALRAPLDDFDRWTDLGCDEWDATMALAYYKAIETDLDFGDKPYHGANGPIPISRLPQEEWCPLDHALRDAVIDMGVNWVDDLNVPDSSGVSGFPLNRRNGRRVSSYDGYVINNASRANLDLVFGAIVDNVLIDEDTVRGVRVYVDNGWRVVHSSEIIVCAGAILSPAILQRSGIGPASVLRRAGVNVVANLPVGEHLQDHPIIAVVFDLNEKSALRNVNKRNTTCCLRFSSDLDGCSENDMFVWAMDFAGLPAELEGFGLFGASVYESFSEGHVRIVSADPRALPAVKHNALTNELDRQRLGDAANWLLDLANHPAVRNVSTHFAIGQVGAIPEDRSVASDLQEEVVSACAPGHHFAGTCRMGDPAHEATVCDASGRVLGITGLRVADASIMPQIVRANTNLTTVMIAEVIADRF